MTPSRWSDYDYDYKNSRPTIDKKNRGCTQGCTLYYNYVNPRGLVGKLSLEVLAVEASDVADAYALGTLGLAGTSVGAVTEA